MSNDVEAGPPITLDSSIKANVTAGLCSDVLPRRQKSWMKTRDWLASELLGFLKFYIACDVLFTQSIQGWERLYQGKVFLGSCAYG